MAAEGNEKCPIAQPILSPRIQQQESSSQDQANFFPANSTVLNVVPARDIPQGIVLPVGKMQATMGLFDSYFTDSSPDVNTLNGNPFMHKFNSHNHEVLVNSSKARYLVQQSKTQSENKFVGPEKQILALNHASMTQKSKEDNCHVPQLHSAVTVAVPGFPSRKCDNLSGKKATATARIRKARIAERFKALRELLPHSEEVNDATVLDDIIDYVKYLQLQIKALSQSRLGGEATVDPFIHLEGYGHYLLYQQMLSDSLEEVIGRLMSVNMEAVTTLLESKGLYMIPMASAEGLFQVG